MFQEPWSAEDFLQSTDRKTSRLRCPRLWREFNFFLLAGAVGAAKRAAERVEWSGVDGDGDGNGNGNGNGDSCSQWPAQWPHARRAEQQVAQVQLWPPPELAQQVSGRLRVAAEWPAQWPAPAALRPPAQLTS